MPLSSELSVESTVEGAARVLTATGELDVASAASLRAAVDAALAAGPEALLLDLSRLAFCDSSGVHLVVDAHRRARERRIRFAVVRPVGPARRVFEICRIDGDIDFVDSAADRSA